MKLPLILNKVITILVMSLPVFDRTINFKKFFESVFILPRPHSSPNILILKSSC
uniref:Uncharacterized protein n=1 Tax=Arundo donax TaxID=35708 RepID=A0A0A9GSB0_ARUDO